MHLREDPLVSGHVVLFQIDAQMVFVGACEVSDHLDVQIEEVGKGGQPGNDLRIFSVLKEHVEVEVQGPWEHVGHLLAHVDRGDHWLVG